MTGPPWRTNASAAPSARATVSTSDAALALPPWPELLPTSMAEVRDDAMWASMRSISLARDKMDEESDVEAVEANSRALPARPTMANACSAATVDVADKDDDSLEESASVSSWKMASRVA